MKIYRMRRGRYTAARPGGGYKIVWIQAIVLDEFGEFLVE
jgi:hypothetical protein